MSSERNFHTDEPITKLEEDILGRDQFSQNLAQAICRYKEQESLVLGLYGSWGSGKTSIINMVLEVLEQEKDVLIVEFKPWYFSGQDQLLKQFFKHLAFNIQNLNPYKKSAINFNRKINNIGDILNKIGIFFKQLSNGLKPVKLIPGVGIPVTTLEEVSSGLENLGKALSGSKTEQNFDAIAQKKELDKELIKLKKRILIIIDDIDRLTKEEMRQMFQLVKGLANFPNTIYLLSFDPQVVTEALKDVQTGDGVKYLEKIVQVPFQIPEFSRTALSNYFLHRVGTIISQHPQDENLDKTYIIREDKTIQPFFHSVYWRELSFRFNSLNYFDNLREINRFLNIFRFDYDFIGNEVNTIDLVVLAAIKSQDNELYSFIRDNKEIFAQRGISVNKGLEEEQYIDKLKNFYLEQCKSFKKITIIELILKAIFPQFRKLFGEHSWMSYLPSDPNTFKKYRRVGHPEIFDTFFQLSISDYQISYVQIQAIISLQNKPEEFARQVKEIILNNKSQELFSYLQIFQEEFEEVNKNNLLQAILPLGDLIDYYKMRVTYDSEEFSSFFITLLENSNIDLASFLQNLHNQNIEGIYLLCVLLLSYAEKHDFYGEDHNFSREKIDNSEHGETFKQLEQLIDLRLQKKADNDSLINEHYFSHYLYTWRRINHEAAKNYVLKLLSTQKGIIDYLTGGLSYYLNREIVPKFEPQYITYFTEVDPLRNQVQEIKNDPSVFNQLPEESQIAISTFLDQFSEDKQT